MGVTFSECLRKFIEDILRDETVPLRLKLPADVGIDPTDPDPGVHTPGFIDLHEAAADIHSRLFERFVRALDLPADRDVPCSEVTERDARWRSYTRAAVKNHMNDIRRRIRAQENALKAPVETASAGDCPGIDPLPADQTVALLRVAGVHVTREGVRSGSAEKCDVEQVIALVRASAGRGVHADRERCVAESWCEALRGRDDPVELCCVFQQLISPAPGPKREPDHEVLARERCKGQLSPARWAPMICRLRARVRARLQRVASPA